MKRRIVLRFRDLVTEPYGTIAEHRSILRSQGEVWWGWWMRRKEIPPRELFAELRREIGDYGNIKGYLCDVDLEQFYACEIVDIKLAPAESGMPSPDPAKSPEYYHRGRYPAWFLLKSLDDQHFQDLDLVYDDLPTTVEKSKYSHLWGKTVTSLVQLSDIQVTLWVLREREKLIV